MEARAQRQPQAVELSVDGELSASDNGNLAPDGQERADLSLTLRPSISARWEGSGLKASLRAGATLLGSSDSSRQRDRNRMAIDLRGSFEAVLIEPVLTLGGEVQLRDVNTDPFAPTVQNLQSSARRTEQLYRLTPRLDLPLDADSNLLARSDLSLTDNGAGTGARRNGHETLLRYERRPLPFGGSIELSRVDSEAPELPDSRYSLTTLRARASLLVSDELLVDLSIGRDEADTSNVQISDVLYGIGARWTPGPRTSLDAMLERRYFGTGGSLAMNHRMPWMALSLRYSRRPGATPTALSGVPRPGDLPVLLDKILTTRVTDPDQRQEQVLDLLDSRGFDRRLQDTADPVAAYPQLQSRLEASVLLLGRRSSASLNLYAQTSRQLEIGNVQTATTINSDSRQRGGTLQLTHLLTPRMSANATMQWSSITGLAARAGASSEQRSLRFSVQQQIAPRTSVVVGVEHRKFTSTAAGQTSFDENRIFAGISHRF